MKNFLWLFYSKDLESSYAQYTTTQVSCRLLSFATNDNSASSISFVFFGSHMLLPARSLAAPDPLSGATCHPSSGKH